MGKKKRKHAAAGVSDLPASLALAYEAVLSGESLSSRFWTHSAFVREAVRDCVNYYRRE